MNRENLKRLIVDPCSAPGTRPTIQGYRFILLTLLLGLAAVNTANNLIYLILAMIAAMVIVSVSMLPQSLRGLSLRLQTPHPVHAGTQAWLTVSIRREHSRPAYDVHVRLPEASSCRKISRARIGRIDGHGVSECTLPFRPAQRGRFRVNNLLLSTGFPFGLMMKTRKLPQNQTVLVYPPLVSVETMMPHLTGAAAGAPASRLGQDGEYLFDREYQHGDSLRHVHWKASARTGRLLVKEYATEEPARVTLYLETGQTVSPVRFEQAVTTTASVAAFLAEIGFYVRLVCEKSDTGFGTGREHLYRILDVLAVVPYSSDPAPLPAPGAGSLIGIQAGSLADVKAEHFDLVIDAEQKL